jgi:hypothetical protein
MFDVCLHGIKPEEVDYEILDIIFADWIFRTRTRRGKVRTR